MFTEYCVIGERDIGLSGCPCYSGGLRQRLRGHYLLPIVLQVGKNQVPGHGSSWKRTCVPRR
jgi:hypothetical protein